MALSLTIQYIYVVWQ